MILPPICAGCRREMRCAQNDVVVRDPPAGVFPSTYWMGDKWGCAECGAEVVLVSAVITRQKADDEGVLDAMVFTHG